MKTILITGASGGLGQEVVAYLHQQGYAILATVGSSQHLQAFANQPNVDAKALNVLDEKSVDQYLAGYASTRIDAAVLLVGGFTMGSLQDTTQEQLRKMYDLNFLSVFNLVKPLMSRFEEQGGGQFILVGARPALRPADGKQVVAYALSKSLVFQLAELINADGKSKSITASVLVPSTIDTPANRAAMPDADTSAWISPVNIAETIGFLLGNTGQMLRETVVKLYNKA